MINLKNIAKVLLIALFVCVWSGESFGQAGGEETTVAIGSGNAYQDPSFCATNQGVFGELLKTGRTIFNRLRDLIYVVAGFGIIAVAVGGFFGNLNWKWLGAIVISLVVIATAGELIVMITGCEVYGSSLITNTLENPTPMKTADYNANYTEGVSHNTWIEWDDSMDVRKEPAAVETEAAAEAEAAVAGE